MFIFIILSRLFMEMHSVRSQNRFLSNFYQFIIFRFVFNFILFVFIKFNIFYFRFINKNKLFVCLFICDLFSYKYAYLFHKGEKKFKNFIFTFVFWYFSEIFVLLISNNNDSNKNESRKKKIKNQLK